jgi:hypothetical protein
MVMYYIYKMMGNTILLFKFMSDVITSENLADFATWDKIGVTAVLAFFVRFYMINYKKLRERMDTQNTELLNEKIKVAQLEEKIRYLEINQKHNS